MNDSDGVEEDRSSFPAQSSVLDEVALFERVVPLYDIRKPRTCRFLTRGDADIYRIRTDKQCYYLKTYRPPEPLSRVEAEGRFVADLASSGVPVVRPVPLRTGGFAHEVHASEGRRPILVFEEAPPPIPRPVTVSLANKIGQAVARLHNAADALGRPYELPVIENKGRNELLPYVREFVSEEDYRFLEQLTEILHIRFEELPKGGADFGWCHCDLVLWNIRRATNDQIVLFDFGNAAKCHRLLELATVWRSISRQPASVREDLWTSFIDGYRVLRGLPEGFAEYLPLAHIASEVGFLGGNAATLPLRLGTEAFDGDLMSKGLERIRRLLESTPIGSSPTKTPQS
jgi:Ser/Thr protein kinase RdoA (MazF antagonist)